MIQRTKEWLKRYFIPHEGNDHKPHILRHRAIVFIFLVVLVAEAAFIFGETYVIPHSKLFGIIETNALVDETNQARMNNGLASLQVSALLQAAAQEKANDMVANDYFAHTSPQGLTPWSWFEKVGYQFSYAGENLAVNFSDSQDVTNAWMNSPEHRANILNGAFTQIGMAAAQGTYDGQTATYVVELFGTPASAPVAFINTAAAATTQSAPASQLAPSKPKPVAVKSPVAVRTAVPVVVASTTVNDSSSQQLFVAVKGATTQASSVSEGATQSAAGTITPVVQQDAATPLAAATQGNAFQQLLSNPKALTNDFYLLLMVLFGVAIILNIFIKIRIQFPRLIFGGMMVVVVSGLFILLNQNIGLFHAAIF